MQRIVSYRVEPKFPRSVIRKKKASVVAIAGVAATLAGLGGAAGAALNLFAGLSPFDQLGAWTIISGAGVFVWVLGVLEQRLINTLQRLNRPLPW